MNKILFNGKIIEEKPYIDMEDRGYQFGDGIYEVIGIYNSQVYLLNEHIDRLKKSAHEIGIKMPFSLERIKKNLLELAQLNQIQEGIIYLQISRGNAPRLHQWPDDPVTPVLIAYTKTLDDITELQNKGGNAILEEDIRWLRCDIKSLNLLPNTLTKQKAIEHNSIEAILHRGEIVTEASSSNVFIVKNSELYTHPSNNYILNGITRKKLIELSNQLEIPVHEKTFTIQELLNADEVFVTATKLDIIPINRIADQIIGDGSPGEISQFLLAALRKDIKLFSQALNIETNINS